MFQEHAITRLAFERDTEPYAKQRDSNISQMAQNSNVEVTKMHQLESCLCAPVMTVCLCVMSPHVT